MREGFAFGDAADATVERAAGIKLDLSGLDASQLRVGGTFHVECYDSEGNLRWRDEAKNSLTSAALDDLINVYLVDATQTATWYLGLVDNASFTAYASADTMASHAGWVESTAYSATSRPAWGNASSTGGAGSTTNASTVNFSMNATATIRGLFLTSNNTKGGTTGTLFSTANFSGGNQAVNNGDTLKVTYTVTATTS